MAESRLTCPKDLVMVLSGELSVDDDMTECTSSSNSCFWTLLIERSTVMPTDRLEESEKIGFQINHFSVWIANVAMAIVRHLE
jgi:hypothetical protein